MTCNPFDLEAPTRSLLAAAFEAQRRCRVCGLEQQYTPLRVALSGRQRSDRHATCRRTLAEWDKRVSDLDFNADYDAAARAAIEAHNRAEQIWEDLLRGLGLPDWYVAQQLASRGEE